MVRWLQQQQSKGKSLQTCITTLLQKPSTILRAASKKQTAGLPKLLARLKSQVESSCGAELASAATSPHTKRGAQPQVADPKPKRARKK